MNENEKIQDALVSHQIYLQRYAGGIRNRITEQVDELLQHTLQQIEVAREEEMSAYTLVRVNGEVTSKARELETEVIIDDNMEELTDNESNFIAALIALYSIQSVTRISSTNLYPVISREPMTLATSSGKVKRITIDQLIKSFNNRVPTDIMNTIRNGVTNNLTTSQIADEITRIVNNRTKRQAEALTRTVVNHVSQQSMRKFIDSNRDIFEGEEYCAILDSRTTIRCAELDGSIFNVGSGPMPPLHINCRSKRVPILKGVARPRKTNYESWLKRQSEYVQAEVLGKKRAELFRNGGYSLDRFVDNTGKVYTLKELALADSISLSG